MIERAASANGKFPTLEVFRHRLNNTWQLAQKKKKHLNII